MTSEMGTYMTTCRFSNAVSHSHLPCHLDVIYDTKMRHRAVCTGKRDTHLRYRCSDLPGAPQELSRTTGGIGDESRSGRE
jgi:hypothetical protein